MSKIYIATPLEDTERICDFCAQTVRADSKTGKTYRNSDRDICKACVDAFHEAMAERPSQQ